MRFSFARLRWSAAPLGLALAACGGDDPVEPSPSPVAMAAVSGNGQEGKAGEILSEPFAVRVTDAEGDGVAGVEVAWGVMSGAGAFHSAVPFAAGQEMLGSSTHADPEGVARVFFRPTVAGTSTVAAAVDGLQGSPVTFTTEATVLVIRLSGDCGPLALVPTTFEGPDGSSDVVVPVGTAVEWDHRIGVCEARIASSSAPTGGESFDSGTLRRGDDRFQFIPGVAGTWEYVDEVSGATGTLTAR